MAAVTQHVHYGIIRYYAKPYDSIQYMIRMAVVPGPDWKCVYLDLIFSPVHVSVCTVY